MKKKQTENNQKIPQTNLNLEQPFMSSLTSLTLEKDIAVRLRIFT